MIPQAHHRQIRRWCPVTSECLAYAITSREDYDIWLERPARSWPVRICPALLLGADLSGAELTEALLFGADLSGATMPYVTLTGSQQAGGIGLPGDGQ
jgi:uncharacterized protein YjbI with pentapeptide repeats